MTEIIAWLWVPLYLSAAMDCGSSAKACEEVSVCCAISREKAVPVQGVAEAGSAVAMVEGWVAEATTEEDWEEAMVEGWVEEASWPELELGRWQELGLGRWLELRLGRWLELGQGRWLELGRRAAVLQEKANYWRQQIMMLLQIQERMDRSFLQSCMSSYECAISIAYVQIKADCRWNTEQAYPDSGVWIFKDSHFINFLFRNVVPQDLMPICCKKQDWQAEKKKEPGGAGNGGGLVKGRA
jgi:hypothetical protein